MGTKKTAAGLAIHSKEWVYLFDSFFDGPNKILDIQTANGIVVSDTQVKVYTNDLDAYLWVHLVEDAPSALSLGRLCDELGYSYSWPLGETPRLPKGKKVIECSIETPSPWSQLPNRKLHHPLNSRMPRETLSEKNQWRTTCWICHNNLQKDQKKTSYLPQLQKLGSDPKQVFFFKKKKKTNPDDKLPSVVTDAGRNALAKENRVRKGSSGPKH